MNLMIKRTLLLTCLICMHFGTNAIASEPKSGDVVGRHIFGLARDYQQSPVMIGEDPLIYWDQVSHHDFASADQDAAQNYTVSLFRDVIGSIYLSERGEQGGHVDTRALDLEPVSGLAYPDAGTRTPWGSLIFSESVGFNTASPDEFIADMAPFFKGKNDLVNPYNYGWPGEVILLEGSGEAKVIKDYGVGRVSASQILVMPDAKTLYLLDGQHSGNLYVFVAEQANSLTQGTLYGVGFDGSSTTYYELGQGAALKTKFRLRRARFDTFFDTAQPTAGQCGGDFRYVETLYGQECLKLKSHAESYAGLFEPIRVMALKSAGNSRQPIQGIEYNSANQSLSLIQAGQQTQTFTLKPDSTMQSQFIMEVSP